MQIISNLIIYTNCLTGYYDPTRSLDHQQTQNSQGRGACIHFITLLFERIDVIECVINRALFWIYWADGDVGIPK